MSDVRDLEGAMAADVMRKAVGGGWRVRVELVGRMRRRC